MRDRRGPMVHAKRFCDRCEARHRRQKGFYAVCEEMYEVGAMMYAKVVYGACEVRYGGILRCV